MGDEPEEVTIDLMGNDEVSWFNVRRMELTLVLKEEDLEEHHVAEIPESLVMKSEQTKDLLLMFTDKKTVLFRQGDKVEKVTGRWCKVCK